MHLLSVKRAEHFQRILSNFIYKMPDKMATAISKSAMNKEILLECTY